MLGDHIIIYNSLTPLSWLYGMGVRLRNHLFDCGVLKSRSFPVPVIDVGNLTVGGTGKTPHTEYLIRLLSQKHRVAVLSRGYKRKSKGFVLATEDTPMPQIGDEPYQMKHKFPDIMVAVDADRCHGIECLLSQENKPEVIILDDAFQHRYVKPSLNICLMDYHRLVYRDKLLPAGRLREPRSGLKRADIVIVTKCPPTMTSKEKITIMRDCHLNANQDFFFSTFRYPESIADEVGENPLLVTGIASPKQMISDLQKIIPQFDVLSFPDHHNFTDEDIANIRQRSAGRTIITTEKDATRLPDLGNIKVIPIVVDFLDGSAPKFDELILRHIEKK